MALCSCWKPLFSVFFKPNKSRIEAIHSDGFSTERWVGLKNLGNTCFINSGSGSSPVMQSLLACDLLLQKLRSEEYLEKAKAGAFCQRIIALHE